MYHLPFFLKHSTYFLLLYLSSCYFPGVHNQHYRDRLSSLLLPAENRPKVRKERQTLLRFGCLVKHACFNVET